MSDILLVSKCMFQISIKKGPQQLWVEYLILAQLGMNVIAPHEVLKIAQILIMPGINIFSIFSSKHIYIPLLV